MIAIRIQSPTILLQSLKKNFVVRLVPDFERQNYIFFASLGGTRIRVLGAGSAMQAHFLM